MRTLLAGLFVLILVVVGALVGCDSGESPTTETSSPSGMDGQGGGGGDLGPALLTTPPTPPPVVSSAPADWSTFKWSGAGLAFQYPSTWHQVPGGGIFSYDYEAIDRFPSDGFKLEPSVLPIDSVTRPEGAADLSIKDASGWQLLEVYDPAKSRGIQRVHTVVLDRNGLRVTFVGYFGPDSNVQDIFWQIIESLRVAR